MMVDISGWDKRNCWTLTGGDLASRPGLRSVYDAEGGRTIVGGFTVPNPHMDDVQHYVADVATSGQRDVKLRVLDQYFVVVQVLSLGADVEPSVITHGVLGDELFISSPDLPPLMGIVGGGVQLAKKKAATNSNFTAVEIPRGLTVSWQDRRVIADGSVLHFSQPGEPRTFLSADFVIRGSPIRGLHVAGDGSLIICQADGVYALPADAAAAGTLVLGVFDRISDHPTHAFGQTCSSRGRLYGITHRGMENLEGKPSEVLLDEIDVPRYFGPRIAYPDYGDGGRMFGGASGPVVGIGPYVHMVDTTRKLRSWWSDDTNDLAVRGLLYSASGEEILLCQSAALRPLGNQGPSGVGVNASVFGRVPTDASLSPVVREIVYAAASDTGGSIYCALRGDYKTQSAKQVAPVIGTDSWGEGTTLLDAGIQSRRFQFAKRTDDIAVELTVTIPNQRIGTSLDITTKGIGRRRP